METLKEFLSLEHWWKLLALVGAVIAIGGIAHSFPTTLIGIGLLLFGSGMWACHPKESRKEIVSGLQGFRVVNEPVWKPNTLGICLSIIGAALFVAGLVMAA